MEVEFCFARQAGLATLLKIVIPRFWPLLILFSLITSTGALAEPQIRDSRSNGVEKLSDEFWKWRATYRPFTGDDVPRLERPGGTRDWSAKSIEKQRADLAGFEARWNQLNPSEWPIPAQVDYRLIGSALARIHWELDVNPRWKRDPTFYIEQTLTPIVEALVVPGPYDSFRSAEILIRIKNIPAIVQDGEANLKNPPAPFAGVAIQALQNIQPRLGQMATALAKAKVTTLNEQELKTATTQAADALEHFREHLHQQLPSLPQETALCRDAYVFFLRNVALMPYSPEELLAMGRQEWNRSVAFETFEKERNHNLPPLKLATDTSSWIKDAAAKERAIREFLPKHGILGVPDWVQHYTLRPMPDYLHTLEGFGEMDDFTSPSRLRDNCIRYVNPPSGDLPYFWRATASDPRPITVHEGIPGHYFQLCLSWRQENPIRRQYYDSVANEGIGFYAEEMMLQAGLFDDSLRTREIIYSFMRLRALRVEVDVKLATGEFTLNQAAKYLQEKVPMDPNTARQEAIAFSTGPAQAITYQIGKLQILKFLAEARIKQGDKFNLRAFHDFVWKNGNVPIALQCWEYLGDASDVPPIGR